MKSKLLFRIRQVALLGPLVLVISFDGCGGGSPAATPGEGSATTASATRAGPQFIARADALCGRINAEIVAIKAKGTSRAEVIRVVPRTLSGERRGIATLEKLDPPASLARDWQRMLGYRRTLARELAELLDLAKKNDGTRLKHLGASKKRAHAGLAKTATASGFKDCAKIGRVG